MSKIKKFPSVTINVTVKNAEDTIKKCIDSLLAVDYPRKQIYVTEAYSTDRTYEILKQYGKRIRLERVRGNAPTAHNHVFKKIKTDFIAFTDADCVVDKNWLKHLLKAFVSDDIVAAGGFCKTPRDVNELQKLIGAELEDRFLKMPKYVSRLPTMNLCVRTDVARKVKMNENLDVTFETDWGKRLTKFGKMAYVRNAIVYHYHRPNWKSFFRQQLNYGKFVIKAPSIYMGRDKFGDYLSKPIMGLEVITFDLLLVSLFASLFIPSTSIISTILLLILLILYLLDMANFAKSLTSVFEYFALFFVRTFAWTVGFLIGLSEIIRGK